MVLSCSPCNMVTSQLYLAPVLLATALPPGLAGRSCMHGSSPWSHWLQVRPGKGASGGLTEVHEVLAVGGAGHLGYLGEVEGGDEGTWQ